MTDSLAPPAPDAAAPGASSPPDEPPEGAGPTRRRPGAGFSTLLPLFGVALVVGAAAMLFAAPDLTVGAYFVIAAAWAAGLVLVVARWPRGGWSPWPEGRPSGVVLEAAALFLTALAWRALAIGTIPPNLLGDEFAQAEEARRFVAGAIGNMFSASDWYGVPYMYMWLGSWAFRLLGDEPWVWRFYTSVAGAGAVATLYLALRVQLHGPTRGMQRRASTVAVLAGLVLCFHHLALLFSRLGSNQGFDPLFMAASLLCLALAWRAPRSGWWYVAGVVAGLGFYFYFALRGVALLTLGAVALLSLRRARSSWRPTAWFIAGLALTVAPLIAALHGSDRFGGRTIQVLRTPGADTTPLAQDLAQRTLVLLSSLQGHGLRGWYESGAGLVVSRLELGLLLLGVVVALRMGRRMWIYPYYLFGVLASVAYLTENPLAGQRSISTAVPIAALIALGAEHVGRLAWPRRRELAAGGLVLAAALANLNHLFLFYLPQRELDTPALVATEVGAYLRAHPEIDAVTFCGGDLMDWGSNAALGFVLPTMVVTKTDATWARPAGYPESGQAIITTPGCTEVRDQLLDDDALEAHQLLFRKRLSRRAALSMFFDTGGLGYLRLVTPGEPDAAPNSDEMEVFTIFTERP